MHGPFPRNCYGSTAKVLLVVSGITTIEVNLDVLSLLLAGLQDPSGSSPGHQGWCPEVTLWWQEVQPEASWGPFHLELLCDLMISPFAYVRSIAQLSS